MPDPVTPTPDDPPVAAPPAGSDLLDPKPDDLPPSGEDTVDATGDDTVDPTPEGDLLADAGVIAQEGVPDQYDYETPEGFEEEAFQEGLSHFAEEARELRLTQKQFEGLLNRQLAAAATEAQAADEAYTQQVEGWKTAALQDKAIGGQHFRETLSIASEVLKQFGNDNLSSLMQRRSEDNPQGLAIGNHPEFLRFLVNVGKALQEPPVLEGDSKVEETEALRKMYPSMF